jgi:hypothetical protein
MSEVNVGNRRTLLLIAGIPVVILLLATVLWRLVDSGKIDLVAMLGTANHGTLLQPPVSLEGLSLTDGGGNLALFNPEAAGHWTLLLPATGPCAQDCEQMLYYTRQIRAAMGKYSDRVERLYLREQGPATPELDEFLLAEHPRMKVLYTPQAQLARLRGELERNAVDPAYYLVDPQGWVMMYYTAKSDGKDVMADLKFLLKNSGD